MPKSDYVNPNDAKFSEQLRNFKLNIPSYAALFGLTPAQISGQAADADYFANVLACQEIEQNAARQRTAWKNTIRSGVSGSATSAPVAAVFPASVPAVEPGVEIRYRALVTLIKNHPNYDPSIGAALGIEGAQQTGPDLDTIQPEFSVEVRGSAVRIDWSWGGQSDFLDMIRLEVDRGDGKGFVLLATDTTPGYFDTAPFPAAPAKWTYRAIYMVGDDQVGQWSNPISIMVGAS